ncbi:LLM class flavin-dependent oxidoreductase [Dactylosporangium sp. NPDC005572]|uniref:LLM class flavin-dependent oxidoreductase n=1 Tax=Dactylosporangium sp. NPDC005572 TaxID=3156889 RepID=UPI0033AA82A5
MKCAILLTTIHSGASDPRVQRREHEELVQAADELGFDVMVAGQHFLGAELRYFQPVPWLAHMARFGPRLRTATGIILLPLVNPVETAEQLATLDVLSDGRAVFGVGLGYSDHEFAAFGVAPGTRVARFEESLALIRRLWSGETVNFHGRFFSVTEARPAVLPLQPGGPPVWIGGQAAGAVQRAARLGDAWYAPPFPTHDELARLRALYLRTRQEAGRPVAGEFPVRRELLIAPTRQAGLAAALERYRARYEIYRKWGLQGENTPVGAGGEQVRTDIADRFVLGPPQECAEQLDRLRTELGMTHFVYKPHWPGLPHAEAMRQLEQFGTQVMPLFAANRGGAA